MQISLEDRTVSTVAEPFEAILRQAVAPRRPDTHDRLFLSVLQIQPNPHNPRQTHDPASLEALADSIKRWGQLQPVVVRRIADGYQLICGERRWLAHQRAGMECIWAVIVDAAESDLLPMALIENLQRVGLSHAEKIAALDDLAEVTQSRGLRRTAQALRVDAGWLSRQLAIRRDPLIFPALESGDLGMGQAAELLRAPETARAGLVQRVVQSRPQVSTAQVRQWVQQARRETPQPKRRPRAAEDEENAYRALAARLEALGAPRTAVDRKELADLVCQAQALLAQPSVQRPLRRGQKLQWVEMVCLSCGQVAGQFEEGRGFRLAGPRSARWAGRGWVCGRCGGALTAGERGQRFGY